MGNFVSFIIGAFLGSVVTFFLISLFAASRDNENNSHKRLRKERQ